MNYSHARARRGRGYLVLNRIWHRHSKLLIIVTIAVLVFTAIAALPVPAQTNDDLTPTAIYFSQDFSASTVVADYVSIAPSSGQFNAIGTTGSLMAISVTDGKLQFSRTGGNSGSFSRTSDFSPIPMTLKYSFELSVSGNTAPQTTAAQLQLGSGFGVGNSAEVLTNVFARLGINWTATTGEWSLRNIAAPVNSPNFTGSQTVTWFINNSDAGLQYLAPDGTTDSLVDNSADVWVGTTRVFDDVAATTPTQSLADLKFVFTAGLGTIQIDNIQITDIAAPTAAAVSISGRVADAFGNAVRDATILVEGPLLDSPRTTRVNTFGFYRIDGLHVGTYNVTVTSRRSSFVIRTRTITVHEDVTDADFISDAPQ